METAAVRHTYVPIGMATKAGDCVIMHCQNGPKKTVCNVYVNRRSVVAIVCPRPIFGTLVQVCLWCHGTSVWGWGPPRACIARGRTRACARLGQSVACADPHIEVAVDRSQSVRSSTHTTNGAPCSPSNVSLQSSPAYTMPMRSITARERTLWRSVHDTTACAPRTSKANASPARPISDAYPRPRELAP